MEEEMVDRTTENENENKEMEYIFTAYEIDISYEFDAPRYFDFSREESPLEVRQAEAWFVSAGSYPPSPFVARLVWRERSLMENIKICSNSKGMESMNLFESNCDCEAEHETSAMGMHYGDEGRSKETSSNTYIGILENIQDQSQKLTSEPTFSNHLVNNIISENQTKLSFPRASTLLKPTESYLAKQNRHFHAGDSRSNSSALDKTSKSSTISSAIENHAAKRQKLEGGLLRKDDFQYEYTTPIKPRITIPRDPNLETARRARRAMGRSSKVENVISTVHPFKALPLNLKILKAPPLLPKRSTPHLPEFKEFHLKTSERVAQHSSSILKSTAPWNHPDKQELHKYSTETTECGSREPRSIVNTASRPDGCQSSHNFKAQPLSKKEFNSQTEQRFHTIPPVELFNKLSLASENTTSS